MKSLRASAALKSEREGILAVLQEPSTIDRIQGVIRELQLDDELSVTDTLDAALRRIRSGATPRILLIDLGAICGLASVMLVMLLGQSRVLYTMSHDGLVWKWAGKVHPRFRTPYITSIVVGAFAAFLAAFFSISFLGELVSLGTLLAFTIVSLGVWIMRVKQPNVPRPFRTPWVPLVPIGGMVVSLSLMFSLDAPAWIGFTSWLIFGLIIYFTYSRTHSKVQRALATEKATLSR